MGLIEDLQGAWETVTDPDSWQYADEAWDMFCDDVDQGLAEFGGFVVGVATGERNDYGDAFVNNFTGFWTGHEAVAEQDLMADLGKVDVVLESLQNINTNVIEEGREAVRAAMVNLNNTPGFNEYVYTLDTNFFDSAFDTIAEAVTFLSQQISDKVDGIVTYNNSSWDMQFLASVGNIAGKFEEGFFGAFEAVDDLLCMGIGFISGGACRIFGNEEGAQACETFWGGVAAQNVVHDFMQDNYYDLFDDYATIQSGSAVGTASQLTGSIAGYTFMSAAVNVFAAPEAAGTSTMGQVAGRAVTEVSVGNVSLTITQGNIINSALAATTFTGSTFARNINSGMEFGDAASSATTQGVAFGAAMFGIGVFADNYQTLNELYMNGKTPAASTPAIDTAATEMTVEEAEQAYNEAVRAHQDLILNGGSDEAIQASLNNLEQTGYNLTQVRNAANMTQAEAEQAYSQAVQNHQQLIMNGGSEAEIQASLARLQEAEGLVNQTAYNAAQSASVTAAEGASESLTQAGLELQQAETNLANAYASGASEAELGALEEARDAASRAYDALGGDSMAVRNATNELVHAETSLTEGWQSGLSEAEVGALEEARDAARHAVDDIINGSSESTAAATPLPTGEAAGPVIPTTPPYGTRPGGSTTYETAIPGTAGTSADRVVEAAEGATSSVSNPIYDVINTNSSAYGRVIQNVASGTANVANQSESVINAENSTNPIMNASSNLNNSVTGNTPYTAVGSTSGVTGNGPYVAPTSTGNSSWVPSNPTGGSSTSTGGSSSSGGSSSGGGYSGGGSSYVAPETTPITEAPTTAPITEVPTTVPITEVPTTAPITEVPTTAPVTEVPTTAPTTEFRPVPDVRTEPRTLPPYNPHDVNNNPSSGNGNGGGGYYQGGWSEGTSSVDVATTEVPTTSPLDDLTDDVIKKGNKYSKIPTSTKTVTTTTTTNKGNSVIPVLAGLSAAAAAGIGAKAYLDRKNNSDNESDEDFKSEDWSTDSDVDIEYKEPVEEKEETLDFDDDGYEVQEPERYDARSHQELEDLQ